MSICLFLWVLIRIMKLAIWNSIKSYYITCPMDGLSNITYRVSISKRQLLKSQFKNLTYGNSEYIYGSVVKYYSKN